MPISRMDASRGAGAKIFSATSSVASAAGDIAGLTGTIPAGSRSVVIRWAGHVSGTLLGDTVYLIIYVDDVAVQYSFAYIAVNGGYVYVSGEVELAPSASARTVKAGVAKLAGAGNASAEGAALYPVRLAAYVI